MNPIRQNCLVRTFASTLSPAPFYRPEGSAIETTGIKQRIGKVPKKVLYGVPLALFALLAWPTPYSYDNAMVGSYGSITAPLVIWNEEQEDACLDDPECIPIYARTRKLRFVGEPLFETWTWPEDSSRWFGDRKVFSLPDGFRAVQGMEVTDESISFTSDAGSRMMVVDGPREGEPPQLVSAEWFVLEEGEAVTVIDSGEQGELRKDAPNLRIVLQAQDALDRRRLWDGGLYLADMDDNVIYWQFEASASDTSVPPDEERDARLREALGIPEKRGEQVTVELIAPLARGDAFSLAKSGKLSLMQGQRGWVLPIEPTEAVD